MRHPVRFALLGPLLAALAWPPAAPGADGDSDRVDFTYHERCVFVTMRAGEHGGLLFLLDTGASASAIDSATAKRLGLAATGTVKVEGTAGVIDARTVLVPDLAAGKARVENIRATTQDLGGSLAPKGKRLDGILGADFLSHFAVTIDFKNHVVEFGRAPVRPGPTMTAVPFTLDNRIPRLKGELNGRVETDVRLDTGASLFETRDVYLNVTEATWQKLTAADPTLAPERYFSGSGAGGLVKLAVARVKSFALGEVSVPGPYVIVQPKVGYFARPDAVGFVGNNLLEKYSPVTIDYPGRKLYLSTAGPGK